ncbi:PREDICTED: uncharacterized protein LOC108371586 [Rhagoletis zephyria]|uniref:uncharacterized protein LOC108371586 n=1 Tax=Rhagoletis zephyria TaxID=28612 RepID=UPI0008115553|nr:PREDICTED: uncharacterized protein LOC108371586 [Rhagoletis zephyria]
MIRVLPEILFLAISPASGCPHYLLPVPEMSITERDISQLQHMPWLLDFCRCSGLRTTREWTANYSAPCCRALPTQTRQQTPLRRVQQAQGRLNSIHTGERQFRRVVTSAAARFILSGRIAEVRPNFPAEAAVLANERDHLRQVDPGDLRLKDLNLEIRQLVNQHKR